MDLKDLENEVKGMRSPIKNKNNECTGEFGSSDPNKPSVKIETICIRPDSDHFDKTKDYVGLIIYLRNGQSQFVFNEKTYRTGDIVIKESNRILNETPERQRKKSIHNRLFYWIFGCCNKKKLGFVCGGFSYLNGIWKFNSGTLNTMNPNNNDDTYHNTDRKLSDFEEKLIRNVCTNLYENHLWSSMHPESRISLESLKSIIYKADFSNVHFLRKLQGTVKWFNYYRGYGFIECIGFDRNIFVHHSAILGQPFKRGYLNDGENVLFNIIEAHRGWEAANVISIESDDYTYH